MRKRSLFLALSLLTLTMLIVTGAWAAPEAHIIRIDPRASLTDGAPVLTVLVDLVQGKRVSEAIANCATLRGNAQYDCQSEALEAGRALFSPFPFPEKNANFLVTVDGAAQPTSFVSKTRWADASRQPDVGTAWLVLLDADSKMGNRFEEAKAVAEAFANSMGPNDILNVMVFNDKQVVRDSKWISAGRRAEIVTFLHATPSYGTTGRTRPLFNIIRSAVNDGFKSLGNAGSDVKIPLHQALVVLSSGVAGGDPSSTGPGALTLAQYMTKGRFPEDNSALPKTPLPVVSIWFPSVQIEELQDNAQEFMTNLANTEIGGFYTNVRQGQSGRASRIVNAVRDRFNQMYILKYRVSCIAPNVQQTFQLVFSNVKPMIAGDASFKDVPVGIDPSTWPLDVNYDYSMKMAQTNPVHPGGKFRIWGNFCWGGDLSRAEVYFLPKNQPAPATVEGGDIETAKRAQQQLIAMNMRGKSLQAADTFVEFEAPDAEKILLGAGDKMSARMIVYDNKARRGSPVDAKSILTLKAEKAPFNFLLVGAIAFGAIVFLLLIVVIFRGGGNKPQRRGGVGAPPPAPIVAGGPQPVGYGAPQAQAYGAPQPQAYGAPQPQAYGAPQAQPFAPQPQPYGAPAQPAAPGGDFMYGGRPPQYGLTGAQPSPNAPPPDPYAQGQAGAASRATISGQAGTYTVAPGADLLIGRDAARCQVVLQEPRISGVHGCLHFENGQLFIRDDGSNNGTFLNNNRIASGVFTVVPPGSMIRFGPIEFVVRMD